ncbi:MAG: hypothetical protein CL916_03935 [Deltaproteobacteria bacterium]|nr:hypothetical protein [Deltaproteobacteria bacterium]
MEIDHFERGLTVDFAVRYIMVDCTSVAQKAQQRHNLTGAAPRLCAEGILASYLLASQIKGEEKLTIQILSQKPKMSFMSDINANGELRAKLSPTTFPETTTELDGVLVVIKHNKQKELYRGVTNIEHSNIAQALHHNLTQSAQVDTIVQFFVLQKGNSIHRAVGIILERLPPTEDLPFLTSEEFFTKYADLTTKEVCQSLAERKLRNENLHDLLSKPISWKCRCSRAKVKSMLFSLGRKELEEIKQEIGYAEVTCHFCNEQVLIENDELQELIDQHTKK